MHVNFRKTICCVGLCSIFGLLGTAQAVAAAPDNMSVSDVQQTKTVTGYVGDSEGALVGVTVLEKGTSNGTVTGCVARILIRRLRHSGSEGGQSVQLTHHP